MKNYPIATLAALGAGIAAAEAHTLGTAGAGLAQGFAHPLGGLDHIVAMVAVGLWAAQLGGRALWAVPATFVAAMALGAGAGVAGLPLPQVELGILGSLLVLGLLVAGAVRMPAAAGAAIIGFFALFHGHAHGSELPEAASAVLYAGGFVLATALLHAAGVALGLALRGDRGIWLVRAGGAATAAAGLSLIVAG